MKLISTQDSRYETDVETDYAKTVFHLSEMLVMCQYL